MRAALRPVTSNSGREPVLIPEIALNPQAAATEYIQARGCDNSLERADKQNSGGWLQGLKDIGSSIFGYMQQSTGYWADKALNSNNLGDFSYSGVNWLTYGLLDGIVQGYKGRNDAMWEDPSLYNVLNWATSGLLDTVKGTFAPEEPLSLQHWLDSASLALIVVGGYKAVKNATSTGPVNTINPPHPSTGTELAGNITGDFADGVLSDKTFTNKTNQVFNYISESKGDAAAQADFDSLNLINIRIYSNGTIAGDLPDGRTVNIHLSTSVKGAPTLEILDRSIGMSIKIRY